MCKMGEKSVCAACKSKFKPSIKPERMQQLGDNY